VDDRSPDRGTHGREAGAIEKAAPRDVGLPAKDDRIGALEVIGVDLVDRAFAFPRHRSILPLNARFDVFI